MRHTAIVPMRPDAMTMPLTKPGVPRAMKRATLAPIAVQIAIVDTMRARTGITVPGCKKHRNGAKTRFRISTRSSTGQERTKHHDAMIRKIVVGRPGTTTPRPPSATHTRPSPASHQRTARLWAMATPSTRSGLPDDSDAIVDSDDREDAAGIEPALLSDPGIVFGMTTVIGVCVLWVSPIEPSQKDADL